MSTKNGKRDAKISISIPISRLILQPLLEPTNFMVLLTGKRSSQTKKERPQTASLHYLLCNGDNRARTDDLFTASEALSQLSYTPVKSLLLLCLIYNVLSSLFFINIKK